VLLLSQRRPPSPKLRQQQRNLRSAAAPVGAPAAAGEQTAGRLGHRAAELRRMLSGEKPAAAATTAVQYDRLQPSDIAAAAQLYLESFPHRASRWFDKPAQAECFYADLFELMRLTYGPTCFAAHHEGRLVGYLILTTPQES